MERAYELLQRGMAAAIEEEDNKHSNMDSINSAYTTLARFCDQHLRRAEEDDDKALGTEVLAVQPTIQYHFSLGAPFMVPSLLV